VGPPKIASFVLDSIDIVLQSLAVLEESPEVTELRGRAIDCRTKVLQWTMRPPTTEEREKMMQTVLGLHIAVAKLKALRRR